MIQYGYILNLKQMDYNEITNFLNTGIITAKISTASKEGIPHVAPVWFITDYDNNNIIQEPVIVFTTFHKSIKAKQLISNPRISICVDDQKPPFSFIIINGIAVINIAPDPDELLKLTIRIAERYMGKDNAEKYDRRNAVRGELIVRVKPTKIIAQKDISG